MGTVTLTSYVAGNAVTAAGQNSNESAIVAQVNGNLENVNISATAGIVDTKLAQITTASKVSGTSFTGLASIPSGAGVIPVANLGSGTPSASTFLLGSGAWAAALAGSIVQVVNVMSNTLTACNTTLPADDSIPQITEGTEVMTLAITPSSATNILRIDVIACVNNGTASAAIVGAALFQDATANALCAQGFQTQNSDDTFMIPLTYWMVAGTASATTFRVRVGNDSGNADFNGDTSARFYGTSQYSSITITEIKV